MSPFTGKLKQLSIEHCLIAFGMLMVCFALLYGNTFGLPNSQFLPALAAAVVWGGASVSFLCSSHWLFCIAFALFPASFFFGCHIGNFAWFSVFFLFGMSLPYGLQKLGPAGFWRSLAAGVLIAAIPFRFWTLVLYALIFLAFFIGLVKKSYRVSRILFCATILLFCVSVLSTFFYRYEERDHAEKALASSELLLPETAFFYAVQEKEKVSGLIVSPNWINYTQAVRNMRNDSGCFAVSDFRDIPEASFDLILLDLPWGEGVNANTDFLFSPYGLLDLKRKISGTDDGLLIVALPEDDPALSAILIRSMQNVFRHVTLFDGTRKFAIASDKIGFEPDVIRASHWVIVHRLFRSAHVPPDLLAATLPARQDKPKNEMLMNAAKTAAACGMPDRVFMREKVKNSGILPAFFFETKAFWFAAVCLVLYLLLRYFQSAGTENKKRFHSLENGFCITGALLLGLSAFRQFFNLPGAFFVLFAAILFFAKKSSSKDAVGALLLRICFSGLCIWSLMNFSGLKSMPVLFVILAGMLFARTREKDLSLHAMLAGIFLAALLFPFATIVPFADITYCAALILAALFSWIYRNVTGPASL